MPASSRFGTIDLATLADHLASYRRDYEASDLPLVASLLATAGSLLALADHYLVENAHSDERVILLPTTRPGEQPPRHD